MTACSMLAPGSWVRPCRQYHGHAMALQVLLSPSDRFLYMQIPHLEHEVQQLKEDLKTHHSVCPCSALCPSIRRESTICASLSICIMSAVQAKPSMQEWLAGTAACLSVFFYQLLPCRPQRCTG